VKSEPVPGHPEPPVRSDQEPARRTPWNRIWAVTKVAGPVIASIAALVISLLSLYEQRQADSAAAAASQLQEAARISYVQQYESSTADVPVLIDNFSAAPVAMSFLDIETTKVSAATGDTIVSFALRLGPIPACSSGTLNVGPIAMSQLKIPSSSSPTGPLVTVSSMIFNDTQGSHWQYSGGSGQLQQVASLPANPMGWAAAQNISWKSSSGCV
jgi:hypothetical protein